MSDRTTRIFLSCFFAGGLALTGGCGGPEADDAPPPATETGSGADANLREGIGTMTLESTVRPSRVETVGVVLDPASIVEAEGEAVTAEAALDASRAELARLESLHAMDRNVSTRAVEETRARVRADESRLTTVRRRIESEWGRLVTALAPDDRKLLVDDLASRRTVFARAAVPGNLVPERAVARLLGREGEAIEAAAIGESPVADPVNPGRTVLLRIDARTTRWPVGSSVIVELYAGGPPVTGLIVPRSAVVRYAGRAWVYAADASGGFRREEVALDVAESVTEPVAGWFLPLPEGSRLAGAEVVVQGAQTLLSRELSGGSDSSAAADAD